MTYAHHNKTKRKPALAMSRLKKENKYLLRQIQELEAKIEELEKEPIRVSPTLGLSSKGVCECGGKLVSYPTPIGSFSICTECNSRSKAN